MKVIVLVKANKQSEAGKLPSQELLAAMGTYNEQLVQAGVMLDGAGLQPSVKGARVKFSGANRTVSNGPFTDSNDLLSGYWFWNVKSMQDAIEWLKKAPFDGGAEIEIRPLFTPEDFAPVMTPELKAQNARLQEQLRSKK